MSIEINITEQAVEIYDGTQRAYLSAYDVVDQPNAGATSVNVMKFRTTDISRDISVVSDSRITMAKAGIYNIQFSAQLDKTDSGDDTVQIWLRKNGQNVANTNTETTLVGNNGKHVAAWNFVVQASAGDYYEIAWHSADTAVFINYIAAASTPTRPAIPSAIVTVTQV
jgi:hypothetical protein